MYRLLKFISSIAFILFNCSSFSQEISQNYEDCADVINSYLVSQEKFFISKQYLMSSGDIILLNRFVKSNLENVKCNYIKISDLKNGFNIIGYDNNTKIIYFNKWYRSKGFYLDIYFDTLIGKISEASFRSDGF